MSLIVHMFERFTEKAIKVVMLSQEESRRLGHNFVGTEQILLGLIGEGTGVAYKVLRAENLNLKDARMEVERIIGRGSGFVAVEIPFTPRAKRVLENSIEESRDLGHGYIGTEHILLALLDEDDGVAWRLFEDLKIDIEKLRADVLVAIGADAAEMNAVALVMGSEDDDREYSLEEYTTNLTDQAKEGRLDPVVGRVKEIERVVQILVRRKKNNPVLIGEPGVGKTAVAEGLAQRIIQRDVPDILEEKEIVSLDIGLLLAGTKYRGEFEDRIKRVMEEVQSSTRIILVIDEVHNLIGAGAAEGAVDAANILKPALARGELQCIGATTIEEYRKHIEKDQALERRFQPVNVPEPTIDETVQILRGLRNRYEKHHMLRISDGALEAAANLGAQFIADRFLPDKAIDVLDESGARVRLENRTLPEGLKGLLKELQETLRDKEIYIKRNDFTNARHAVDHELEVRSHIRIMKQAAFVQKEGVYTGPDETKLGKRWEITRRDLDFVNEDDVASVISRWTGVPVNKLTDSESERLMNMESILHERMIGQDQAVASVSKAIRRARAGIQNPDRPIASFIFAGPTGVGKTELTKTLSEYIFGDDDSMIRLDMSEFMEKHTVAKLIGSPPGYVGYNEGGQLTEAVRTKPYAIVLFDEVEKAHPDVFNLLLQILDDGRLSDSKGRRIDFTNTLIIMTTNLGSKILEQESGIKPRSEQDGRKFKVMKDKIFGWEPKPEPVKDPELLKRTTDLVKDELRNFFRPEFLNRIDEIIVFSHLTRSDIWEICALMIKQLEDRLKEKEIILTVEESVRALLTDEGYDPIYGARPLRRAIMKYLENDIAEQCLSKTLYPNTAITVRRKKFEDSTFEYTNELEINIDYSHVDPKLLRKDGIKLGDVHPSPYITSDWTPEQEDQWYENNQAVYMSAEDEKIITDFKEKEENESEKSKETNNEDS